MSIKAKKFMPQNMQMRENQMHYRPAIPQQSQLPIEQPKKKSFWSKLWGGIKNIGGSILGNVGNTLVGGLVNPTVNNLNRHLEGMTNKLVDNNPINRYLDAKLGTLSGQK